MSQIAGFSCSEINNEVSLIEVGINRDHRFVIMKLSQLIEYNKNACFTCRHEYLYVKHKMYSCIGSIALLQKQAFF